ncbi:MAG: tRNA lysidine(34) synthetase TilS [Janthinobacterium lividum]
MPVAADASHSADPLSGRLGADEFAALMMPLGPWPGSGAPTPIAVAVSGGADSTSLALLVREWTAARGIRLLALVVDHGLRASSGQEAAETVARLQSHGIPARLLEVDGLRPGPAMAERARIARYEILTRACRDAGAIDLLLGHHAGDQAETVLMRMRAASGPDGLAGMAALVETRDLRLVRPLLSIAPARLRAVVKASGIGWVEDPSNHDPRALRTRLRSELGLSETGLALGLLDSASARGVERAARQRDDASALATGGSLRPEGFALLPPALLPAGAMTALIRTVGGAAYRPQSRAIEALLRQPHAATLAGTRLTPAGRLGPGWLLLREATSIGPDQDAADGVVWDGRYRLEADRAAATSLADVLVSALGAEHVPMRAWSRLPAAVLSTLPVLRREGRLLAVPHLSWSAEPEWAGFRFRFQPPSPASEAAVFMTG